MVQRKVSNKLGIQANNLLKTEKRQAKIKPSIQTTHDGKSKAPDLKIKKMKKSRPIKRADLEISLRSSPQPHQAPRQPGKPPPLGQPTKTPSPKKASASPCKSSLYGSPNYMKSTSSSEARKEHTKVSDPSSTKLHKAVKTVSKTSSLNKVRTLTKAPSFKHTRTGVKKCSKVVLCDNLDVQRDTCSSTLKDSKFPPYLELSPGATEAEGTSTMKVCPYNYCSLNGHHHKPAPPLRCFLSSRRKLLKTQKVAKPEVLSPRKARVLVPEGDQTEDFFIEICVPAPGRDVTTANEDFGWVPEMSSDKSCSHSEDAVSSDVDFSLNEHPPTPAQDQTLSDFYYNETEAVDNSATVSLYEFLGETSDMEWEEGQINISVQNEDDRNQDKPGVMSDDNERGYFEEFVVEKLKSCFDEDIMECECFSDAGSVPDCESTQSDEEQIDDSLKVERESNINSRQQDEDELQEEGLLYAYPELLSTEQDSYVSECIDEITEAGNEDIDFYPESAQAHGSEEAQDNYQGGHIEEENNDVMKETLSNNETIHGTEEETLVANNDSQVELDQSEAGNDDGFNVKKNNNEANEFMIMGKENSKEQNEDCVATVEEPEMEEINKTEAPEIFTILNDGPSRTKGAEFSCEGVDTSQELLNSCNKLRRSMRHKKENEDSEEAREFNPRGPNFLPVKPEPESEKVDLRHQEMDERRNAEEWMLDYALRKTVNQLAPARKRKVALLVEAFESVIPSPKYEPHLQRNSSGFAHARPIQACS